MRNPSYADAPAGANGRGVEGTAGNVVALHRNHSASGPLARILERLDRVRRSGRGFIARCPAHEDRTASLSLAEGQTGAVVLHCFAGCGAADVLHAIGLTLADLYPERITSDPVAQRELREFAKIARWAAAMNVFGLEAKVVAIAARDVSAGRALNDEDSARLLLAIDRIDDARGVLHGRR